MIRKAYILKTISLFLSFWMLFASVGLSVDFHYCEGQLVDWSLIGEELKCDHEKEETKQQDSCCEATHEMICHKGETAHEDSNCCDSDEAEVVIESEFNISSEEIDIAIPTLFLFSFYFSIPESNFDSDYLVEHQQKPPIPINRKLATLQTFLL